MPSNQIELVLRVTGADQARAALTSIANEGKAVGPAVSSGVGSVAKLDAVLQKAGVTGRTAGASIKQGADSGKAALDGLGNAAVSVESKSDRLKTTLGALGAGAALAGLNMFASKLVAAGTEAGNVDAKLTGMLRARGESGALGEINAMADRLSQLTGKDDDLFKDSAAHLLSFGLTAQQIGQIMPGLTGQADTMGQSLDSAADSFGRAFASGNVGALARSGVVLDENAKAAIENAKAHGEAAGKAELFKQVLASYASYATKAGEGVTDAAKTIGYFGTTVGNTTEAMGTGAMNARAAWMGFLTPVLKGLNENHQGLLEFAGATVEVGTMTVNALAPAVGAWMQYSNYVNAGRIAKALDTGVTVANTTATEINTAATVLNGNAALAASFKVRALASAKAFATGPGGAVVLGVGLGLLGYDQLQKSGALGDDAAPTGEAIGNTFGRIGAFLTTGHSSNYDERIKADNVEQESLRLTREREAKRPAKPASPSLIPPSLAASISISPTDSAAMPTATVPTAGASASFIAAGYPSGAGAGFQSQIDALQDQIRATKDKTAKAQLQDQLHALQRQARDAKATDRNRTKAEKAQTKETSIDARSRAEVASIGRSEQMDALRDRRDTEKEDAKDALDDKIRAIRKAIKGKTLTSEKGNDQITALQDVFKSQQDALDLRFEAQIKELEAQSILAEADAKAITEDGAQKAATIRVAQAKAAKARSDGARALLRAAKSEEDAREAGKTASAVDANAEAKKAMAARIAELFPHGTAGMAGGEVMGYLSRMAGRKPGEMPADIDRTTGPAFSLGSDRAAVALGGAAFAGDETTGAGGYTFPFAKMAGIMRPFQFNAGRTGSVTESIGGSSTSRAPLRVGEPRYSSLGGGIQEVQFPPLRIDTGLALMEQGATI